MKTIEITFPVDVDIPDSFCQALSVLVGNVCRNYEKDHPDRAMWVYGQGSKITYIPMTKAEEDAGRNIEVDHETYHIAVAERANYDFECTKCGFTQVDHKHCITEPPAGDCEFSATQ